MKLVRPEQIELSYIMPVFFNQQNTRSLTDLLEAYAKMSPEVTRRIQFVIVDDCSPVEVVIPPSICLNYQLLRIKTDIRWNQAGARNLGVVCAPSSKIILTDCDHFFPEKLLKRILDSKTPVRRLYKFKRTDEAGRPQQSPCNIFYTTKAIFFSTLGYDEEFCGHYGYEDVMFRCFQQRMGNKLRYFTRFQKIVSNAVDREKSYHDLKRDTEVNRVLLEKKQELLKRGEPFCAHSRRFLCFDYEKRKENWMEQP